jgi:hypothetical protein
MKSKSIILTMAFGVSLTGCTCREEIKAYVKDSESRAPVKDVMVETIGALKGKYKKGSVRYSDSNGRFVAAYDINNIAKCPTMKLFISRAGYEDKIVIEPQEGDTIFIDKIQ